MFCHVRQSQLGARGDCGGDVHDNMRVHMSYMCVCVSEREIRESPHVFFCVQKYVITVYTICNFLFLHAKWSSQDNPEVKGARTLPNPWPRISYSPQTFVMALTLQGLTERRLRGKFSLSDVRRTVNILRVIILRWTKRWQSNVYMAARLQIRIAIGETVRELIKKVEPTTIAYHINSIHQQVLGRWSCR